MTLTYTTFTPADTYKKMNKSINTYMAQADRNENMYFEAEVCGWNGNESQYIFIVNYLIGEGNLRKVAEDCHLDIL